MALAVDVAAAVGEDVERLVGLDEHPGALEHLEAGEMDVAELGLGEDVEAQAAAARSPGEQVAFHAETSGRGLTTPAPTDRAAARGAMCSVNFWTELIGTSNTSLMWNLASIAPGSLG